MAGQGKKEQLLDQVKYQERANRILDASLELLHRWGYRKTTLDDIAKQAGVTKGVVYQHWKTREALFEALLLREYLVLMQNVRQGLIDGQCTGMLSSLVRYIGYLVISHPLFKAIFLYDTEMLGDLIYTSTGQQLLSERLGKSNLLFEYLRTHGLLRTNLGIETQTKMLTAIWMGFFHMDQIVPLERRFTLDEMIEGLTETIQRTFEPEEPPSSVTVEEVTHAFIDLLDQFIDGIERIRQQMA